MPTFVVNHLNGTLLFNSSERGATPNLLHWPSPLDASAYPIVDYPRFTTPPWGPTPIPTGANVDPILRPTNGYDFRNNVNGDTFVFLLGNDLETWNAARA